MEPTPAANVAAHSGIALQARELAEREGITVAAAVARITPKPTEETKDTSTK